MNIGEVARRSGASVKAVRYYEQLGLLTPARGTNGYREYDETQLRVLQEIRELAACGIAPSRAHAFVACLDLGHEHGDDCVSSLAVYRKHISELDHTIDTLIARRNLLQARLSAGAERGFLAAAGADHHAVEHALLPEGLPAPEDDGAATHLLGMRLPALRLPVTGGGELSFESMNAGTTVLYLYPLTGRPDADLPEGWESIPGARGCTAEACDFRDHYVELREAGADRVFGLSGQSRTYQMEVARRLRLPFQMISDEGMLLGAALSLPTFTAPGHEQLYSRLTLIVVDGVIDHVFYPIFPPNTHAQQVLHWLRARKQT